MDNELKPCPFCGSEPVLEDHGDNGWYIGCENYDCGVRPSLWGYDKEDAIEIWNTRENA